MNDQGKTKERKNMNEEMTEKTREFLLACKEAGYERVTIFIHDKRVPCSVQIRKGSTGWDADEDGISAMCRCAGCGRMARCKPDEIPTECSNCQCKEIEVSDEKLFNPKPTYPAAYWGTGGKGRTPFKVVCGAPERLGPRQGRPGNDWPLMWTIVKEIGLNERGAGSRDGHDVRSDLCHLLTAGYYDLSELN